MQTVPPGLSDVVDGCGERPPAVPALQEALLAWARPRLRDLRWRRTRDPWRVLVAEVMLQQTGVGRHRRWATLQGDRCHGRQTRRRHRVRVARQAPELWAWIPRRHRRRIRAVTL